jgi:hypothetical protein
MIRTLAWKEYREQRAVWLIMAVFGAAAIWAGHMFLHGSGAAPTRGLILPVIALSIVGVFGVVSASMLLAGERESATLRLLDALTPTRTQIWRTKALTGAALSIAYALVIAIVVVATGFRLSSFWSAWTNGIMLAGAMVLLAVEAFAWGMLLSAQCRSVLSAVGLAALALGLSWIVALYIAGVSGSGIAGALIFQVIPSTVALVTSWWLFSSADVERAGTAIRLPGWLALAWLTWRQGRTFIICLFVAAIAAGCLLPRLGATAWPPLSLAIGLLCGTAVFAPEQAGGWRRFISDQRLPPTRVWGVKTLAWLTVALVAAAATFLWAAFRFDRPIDPNQDFSSKISLFLATVLEGDHRDMKQYEYLYAGQSLLLWLAYGFSVAAIVTMAVRKTVVALLISVMLAPGLLILWFPSLVIGDVEWWQLYAPPLLLLAFSWALMWAWAGDGLCTGRGLAQLALCCLGFVAWTAGTLWHRVVSVPNVPVPFDMQAYRATIATEEGRKSGHMVQAVALELPEWQTKVRAKVGPLTKAPFPDFGSLEPDSPDEGAGFAQRPEEKFYDYYGQAYETVERGWPADPGKLDAWLQLMFEGPWMNRLRDAADGPPGVMGVLDIAVGQPAAGDLHQYYHAGLILGARALQVQAHGDDAAALQYISWGLALSRNVGNRAGWYQRLTASQIEGEMLTALMLWASKPNLTPRVLGQALHEVRRHQRERSSADDVVKTDYLAVSRALDQPSNLRVTNARISLGTLTVELSVLAVQAPWERDRLERLIRRYYFANDAPRQRFTMFRLPFLLAPGSFYDRGKLSYLQRAEVTLALLLYQAEHQGQAAQKLSDLVPKYLPETPIEPITGKPFGYYVSRGEVSSRKDVQWVVAVDEIWKTIQIPAGWGILTWGDREQFAAPVPPSNRLKRW